MKLVIRNIKGLSIFRIAEMKWNFLDKIWDRLLNKKTLVAGFLGLPEFFIQNAAKLYFPFFRWRIRSNAPFPFSRYLRHSYKYCHKFHRSKSVDWISYIR